MPRSSKWGQYIPRKGMNMKWSSLIFIEDRYMFPFLMCTDGYSSYFFPFPVYHLPSYVSVSLEFYLHKLFSCIFVLGHALEGWQHQCIPLSTLEIPISCSFSRNGKSDRKTEVCPWESCLCASLLNTCFSLSVKGTWTKRQASWVTSCLWDHPSFTVPEVWTQSKTSILLV